MSPLAAKELVIWLSKKVEEFEKDFGKISEPLKSDEAKKINRFYDPFRSIKTSSLKVGALFHKITFMCKK